VALVEVKHKMVPIGTRCKCVSGFKWIRIGYTAKFSKKVNEYSISIKQVISRPTEGLSAFKKVLYHGII
jgi:hypothetical protein